MILIQMHSQQQAIVSNAVMNNEKEASFCCCVSRKSTTKAKTGAIYLYNTHCTLENEKKTSLQCLYGSLCVIDYVVSVAMLSFWVLSLCRGIVQQDHYYSNGDNTKTLRN